MPLAVPGTASLPGVEAPRRGPVYGSRFAIATDHPTASLVGMDVLRTGGNAVDATIATAAVNVVTKPHRTHLGGDAFALIWRRRDNSVECLNAGGRASGNATADRFADGIPARGALASTVPGLVDSWLELHTRHGSRALSELLAPAIELAESGFPVSMRLAAAMTMLVESSAIAATPSRLRIDSQIRQLLHTGRRRSIDRRLGLVPCREHASRTFVP